MASTPQMATVVLGLEVNMAASGGGGGVELELGWEVATKETAQSRPSAKNAVTFAVMSTAAAAYA